MVQTASSGVYVIKPTLRAVMLIVGNVIAMLVMIWKRKLENV